VYTHDGIYLSLVFTNICLLELYHVRNRSNTCKGGSLLPIRYEANLTRLKDSVEERLATGHKNHIKNTAFDKQELDGLEKDI